MMPKPWPKSWWINAGFKEDKKGILDVRVKTRDGRQINIEIQILPNGVHAGADPFLLVQNVRFADQGRRRLPPIEEVHYHQYCGF